VIISIIAEFHRKNDEKNVFFFRGFIKIFRKCNLCFFKEKSKNLLFFNKEFSFTNLEKIDDLCVFSNFFLKK